MYNTEELLTHKSWVLKVHSSAAASYSYFRQYATPHASGTAMSPFPPKVHKNFIMQSLEI